jgi:hypothetical protein
VEARGIVLKELLNILSIDLFRKIVNNKSLRISQLNSLICLLIKEGIEFRLSHVPRTASSEASTTLTIYIRPGVSLSVNIRFDSGEMIL